MTDENEEVLTKDEYIEKVGSEKGYGMYVYQKSKTKVGKPFYNSYGLIKVAGGYKVHTMKMHGKKVLSHSYTEAEPKNFALNKLLSKLRADLNEDN